MLVFIDESGDAGFKLNKGSTRLFVIAMVVFASDDAARSAQDRVERIAHQVGHRSEFKFSNCRDHVRSAFFGQMIQERFRVRALVVDKASASAGNARSDSDRPYDHFVQSLLLRACDQLSAAKIVIDGAGPREADANLKKAIRQHMPMGSVASVRLKNSKSDRLLQLADMCVGAVYRAYRPDERQDDNWLNMLQPNIDEVRFM